MTLVTKMAIFTAELTGLRIGGPTRAPRSHPGHRQPELDP